MNMTLTLALLQCLVFCVMVSINYITSSGSMGAVAFSNTAIANTHPVYGLPIGWAFSIWGIIFLLLGLYTVYQVVPSERGGGLGCERIGSIRVPVLGVQALNAAWLFLFGWEQYWLAFVIIVLYDVLLFVTIRRLRINYFVSIAGQSRAQSLRTKLLVATAFSVHAGWVTVASVLNVQVNALEEGWLPSAGFSVGLLGVACAIACMVVFVNADVPYALASVWALGGVAANQAASSTFGCASLICTACAGAPKLPVCTRPNTAMPGGLANGWAGVNCSAWASAAAASIPKTCGQTVVPKSALVQAWALAAMAAVAVALVAGIVRALCWTEKEAVAAAEEIEAGKITSKHSCSETTPDTASVMAKANEPTM